MCVVSEPVSLTPEQRQKIREAGVRWPKVENHMRLCMPMKAFALSSAEIEAIGDAIRGLAIPRALPKRVRQQLRREARAEFIAAANAGWRMRGYG